MEWTTTPPVEPGYYLLRQHGEKSAVEVKLLKNGTLDYRGNERDGNPVNLADVPDGTLWLGPVCPSPIPPT